jgi:imidazolonepropionase-like amidohydrolase
MIRVSIRVAAVSLGLLIAHSGLSDNRSLAQGQNSGTVALTGARVLDGTGRPAIEQATIIVAGGKIQEVGPAASVKVPAGATRVDVAGKTIVPGIINAHGHIDAARDSSTAVREQLVAQLRMYAEYGVTTAYSLGSGPNDAREGLTLRDQQEQGPLDRARLYSAGLVIADKIPDEARKSVDRNADQKVDIIKIRVDGEDSNPNKMKPEVYRAVIDQAHKRGMRVAAHLFYLKDAQGLVDAGADVIAHSIRDQDVPPAFIAELKKRNVGYIPTLTRDLSVFVYESTPAFFSEPFFLRGQSLYGKQVAQLKDPAAQEKVRNNKDAQSIKKALEQASRNLKLLSDGGVPIAMGTDSGANLVGRWQGYFEHTEMEMMAKAGMTPAQTIAAATSGAARVMHLDGKLGTLQPGKWADFVVLDANPMSDIKNLRQIAAVWIGGQRLAKMSPATAAN